MVYAVDIDKGIATVGPVVIQTDQVTAYTEGEISLRSEHIDLSFKTVPRKGLGLSATTLVNPFFKVGGSLAHPAIELDSPKSAISGGLTVATSGISAVVRSMSDRWLGGNDPCGDAQKMIRIRDEESSGH
jgi:hypothetical protein